MAEKKDKSVIVNNSNEAFVNGVLYGIKFGIEMIMDERVNCDKENGIATLMNETLDACWGKIFRVFELIRDNNRVPDFDRMISSWKEDARQKESKKKQEELLEKMWSTFSK